jgi:predicted nuclease of predicted toxin-antitoxin system
LKFLVDMPLSLSLARWLKSQGYDTIHASEYGLECAPDEEIVQRASRDQRVIITADLDFPRLLALSQVPQVGLILFRYGDFSDEEARDRLERVLNAVTREELTVSIIVVERTRIRRRRLVP